MKHFILFFVIIISSTAFSQTNVDSISAPKHSQITIIEQVDVVQIARIDNIEKSLTAFYRYNRRSHSLLFLSVGLSVVGILVTNTNGYNSKSSILPVAGTVVGLIGTVIYLDSFKFLNFKTKRRELRQPAHH